jgi:adenosylcobinamide-phosphate synthase
MLLGLTLMQMALLLVAGIVLDLLLGEARRWHPLSGFGALAGAIEKQLDRGPLPYLRGTFAWALAVLPLSALALWLCCAAGVWLHALFLYLAIGLRSLREHNLPIARALDAGELAQARLLTSRIVSRDTASATPVELAKASTESLLENGNDAVFAALFWFAFAGGPGALLYRLANTLDAMWGYRNARYLRFGWCAARTDDLLNYLPARLTSLTYVLFARERRRAWQCWQEQAPVWPSPNAGPVMASGAGALGIELGGEASYEGTKEMRPKLGYGRGATAADIGRAWRLVTKATALWAALAIAAALARGALHA